MATNALIQARIDAGVKARAASVPAVELAVTSGHADSALLLRRKSAEMLGLFPLLGAGNVSGALPMFCTVTICGLSLLVEPAGVAAKLSEGGVARLISVTTVWS